MRPTTAGTAPGSIIAAIIDTHAVTKNENDPSSVETPMSIPLIRCTATSHDTAASPSVAVSAAAVGPRFRSSNDWYSAALDLI
jgi:hypothetical protein